jgi:adenosylcobinamide-GDP ribazoletransferase
MIEMRNAYFLAQSLLTRLPTPHLNDIQAEDSGRSALFYPVVGLVIGLILYVPILLFSNAAPILLAAIITVLWVIITGGLHLDGLADSADGWLGGMGDREKTQIIMKDPLVGSAGAIAIVCLLLLKFVALTVIFQQTFHDIARSSGIIIIAPVIARAAILLLFNTSKYAQEKGMVQQIIDKLPRETAWIVVIVCGLVGLYFSFWGMIIALTGFWLLRRLMHKTLGGFTGDTTGALVEITEVLFLIGAVLI